MQGLHIPAVALTDRNQLFGNQRACIERNVSNGTGGQSDEDEVLTEARMLCYQNGQRWRIESNTNNILKNAPVGV